MCEKLLGLEILNLAIKSGREYGWKRSDVEKVLSAAKSNNLACLGGQIQFIVPEGTCEAYWLSYDPQDRKFDESWQDYVARSNNEVNELIKKLSDEIILDATKQWPVLSNYLNNIFEVTCFILYFQKNKTT